MQMKPHVVNDALIKKSIRVARKNWNEWRDVFEHSGPISSNPLLSCQDKFALFCKDYSVHRTIRGGKQNKFRSALQKSPQFKAAIRAGTGQALGKIENKLRLRFGTKSGRNHMISVFSKVAAFLRPERFVAWDRFARKGLIRVLGPARKSYPLNTYSEYLAAFNHVWEGQLGKRIKEHLKGVARRGEVESQSRFQRRVLDGYLMKCGGRQT
jgi:hypothetical protein